MPVHHDKSVYGKLAPVKENIQDDDLIAMAQELCQYEESEPVEGGKKRKKEVENEK